MRRDIKLYNLIFPMWGIYFFSLVFLYFYILLLPANFIVDTVMLFLIFALLKLPGKKELYKESIWKAWGFGFLADILASGVLVGVHMTGMLPFNPYLPISTVAAFVFTTGGVVMAGILIYFFHMKWVWKDVEIEEAQKRKIALGMAILTAPYMMYLPPLG